MNPIIRLLEPPTLTRAVNDPNFWNESGFNYCPLCSVKAYGVVVPVTVSAHLLERFTLVS